MNNFHKALAQYRNDTRTELIDQVFSNPNKPKYPEDATEWIINATIDFILTQYPKLSYLNDMLETEAEHADTMVETEYQDIKDQLPFLVWKEVSRQLAMLAQADDSKNSGVQLPS